jgi:hypothetical protein
VTLRPGDLVGLPALAGGPSDHIVLRYTLFVLALACAALAARGRRGLLLVGAIVFLEAVLVFWTASFPRPYGLFVDAGLTRTAAETATATLPGPDGALSGEPRPQVVPVRLARWGIAPELVIALPTLLPLLVAPVLGVLVFFLGPPRTAAESAVLWLAFSTPETAALRGDGFLTGLWSHPGASLLLVAVMAAVLALGRLGSRPVALAAGTLAAVALVAAPPAASTVFFADRPLALTFDQGPWLLLGAYGLARGAPPAAWSLVAGGGALYLAGAAAADTWATHAAYRMGLILAATGPVLALARHATELLAPQRVWRAVSAAPERFGFAAFLALALPGGFVARWNPAALDPVAAASQGPLSANLQPGLAWLRTHAPEGATCLASPSYAAQVAVLGRRRVLRAPELWSPADDQRRRRTERMLLAGREPELLRRYQLGCVFFGSGDEGWLGVVSRGEVDRVPALAVGYRDPYVTVYRLRSDPPAP